MARPRTGRLERHRRRYRVTWWVNGERKRRSFADENEAREFLGRLRSREEQQAPRLAGGLTVTDVVANWYRLHKLTLSPGTQRDYEGRIRRDIAKIGGLDAESLAKNPLQLEAFYASLSPTSARRLHAILRQAFQDALHHDEVSRNPCEVARPRKPRTAEKLIPTPTEVEKIVIAAEEESPTWGLFVNITGTLGTRRRETCALRWEDFDFGSHRVAIRRSVCKGVNGPTEIKLPKNGRERSVLVGREFFQQILALHQNEGWVFSGGSRTARRRTGLVPWHPDWPGHRFEAMTERLGLPYTLHSLRHFVATQLLARGLPVTQVARFLGHKDPSVTMNLYANHIVDEVQRLMGEAAASLFSRSSSAAGGGT